MSSIYTPIRVILADDHEIFREGLGAALEKQEEIKIAGEASNGEELIAVTEKLKPDIVLTDIRMPVMDGIEATRILTEKFPQIYVIGLSVSADDKSIVDMMEAGAKGYLLKSVQRKEIIEAIKTVHRHEMYFCKKTADRLIQLMATTKFNPYKNNPRYSFKDKELEVIRLICQEFSNKEISERLHSSVRTVEGYRKKIQEKMNVKNSAGIVVYAIKNKIYTV